ncbi:MAG: hypothetical protein HZB18_07770 [Chloroflexi bacterium]|nr:hypothetical protein [Chloroflexota bacterium]
MNIFKYFDLDLMPEEPELGSNSQKTQKRRKTKNILNTLLMYLFVLLGIIGQKLMEVYRAGKPVSWESLGPGFLLIAIVIATVIFPVVFPKVFAKMPARARKAEGGWFIVQLCVAFQNGFFWQALLGLIIPK